ncbi:MAG: chemotaxis response regulator protein-glutamate methylesterase [Parvibaculum sp.]|uniref:protein-glutamate methylesterase/protein-glutamine glutaminase n=1 Tax=Parvibaculum sp. TaxID=2024848 RepID=UPI002ABB8FCA|nr:chemotaxis response regulator protein-glutamate methylesterase [Parvibaculum sp.]MDZ4381016.1 chemotaxis response regulator protein-glutamate methylesterase [Parvibaculum sp.]
MSNSSMEDRGKEMRGPCRVMVVDDSAVARGIVTRTLEEEASIKVVASASNGLMALKAIERQEIDVVILDIEMPELDGLAALPRLLEIKPDLKVIMVSSASQRDADMSLKTMAMGAAGYVEKPKAGLGGAESFRAELVKTVKAQNACAAEAPKGKLRAAQTRPTANAQAAPLATVAVNTHKATRPEVIAIGSSTGGPQALAEVLKNLDPGLTQPILVTQHMPATFTALLAEHMTRYSGRLAAEARDGETLEQGRIYVAPGGKHMLVEQRAAGGMIVRLDDGPPENSCKPAVDPMLRSLARHFKEHLLAVILTGMGCDGLKGCRSVLEEGGRVLAQDRDSSVVWGMPGAVAQAGICEEILPLQRIRPAILRIAMGERK